MNTPASVEGNWQWRLGPSRLEGTTASWLRSLAEDCGRLPHHVDSGSGTMDR